MYDKHGGKQQVLNHQMILSKEGVVGYDFLNFFTVSDSGGFVDIGQFMLT